MCFRTNRLKTLRADFRNKESYTPRSSLCMYVCMYFMFRYICVYTHTLIYIYIYIYVYMRDRTQSISNQ